MSCPAVIINPTNPFVVIRAPGPRGPAGSGSGMGSTFEFDFAVPTTTVTIPHNLNRYPSVLVVDSSGQLVALYGVQYTNANTVVLTFAAAFAGTAYLN